MLAPATRRPLGSWKGVVRRTRQQNLLLLRTLATAATPPSTETAPTAPIPAYAPPPQLVRPAFHAIKSTQPNNPVRTGFAVWPRAPSSRDRNPAALEAYHAQQIRRLDRTGARSALFSKANRDSAKVGDVLQVTTARGEPFSGVCLSIRRAGVDTAILLRNHMTKVGVELWFKIYSPRVQGIEVVWRRPKRARRARLFYMRQPKHDMGNVDHLVRAWRRTRNVFSSKGRKGKGGSGAQLRRP
ncbi:translation protein SH3-like domain-containing protein [Xylariomycetidae sp. FL0641]|nr:translation protein SH3-like domain-containing protein [Xylariomycetidae sp. FL0641]